MFARARTLVSRLFQGPALLFTNCATCGGLMALGDAITQNIELVSKQKRLSSHGTGCEEAEQKYNWQRTLRMGIVGLAFGPLNHGWYWVLDKYLPQRSAKIIARKIVLDQVCASPVFMFTFFIGVGTLEGHKLQHNLREFKEKFWTVYKADWTLWPPAQVLNFYFIPSQFRVAYVAIVTLGWNTYLSYAKHQEHLN